MKKKFIRRMKALFTLSIFLGAIFLLLTFYFQLKEKAQDKALNDIRVENASKEKEYNECLVKEYEKDQNTEDKLTELDNYIKNNYPYTSVEYYDLSSTLKYTYNEDAVYYGASLIKTLDALYLYNKALEDETILDKTLTYTESYRRGSSIGMANYSYGSKVAIKDLVKYAISVSDNSAHLMLIDYIGFSKLKAYGNSIGNNLALIGGDNYGNIDLDDAFNYMFELNKFINNNEVLGEELKSYFDNDYDNFLNFDGVDVIHKYGYYSIYFHDIGIVQDENPYIIVVLTNYGTSNFQTVVNNISKKVNELHKYYYEEKSNNCFVEVYHEYNG